MPGLNATRPGTSFFASYPWGEGASVCNIFVLDETGLTLHYFRLSCHRQEKRPSPAVDTTGSSSADKRLPKKAWPAIYGQREQAGEKAGLSN